MELTTRLPGNPPQKISGKRKRPHILRIRMFTHRPRFLLAKERRPASRCYGSLSTPIKQLLYVLALAAFNRVPTCINPVSMNDSSKVIGWVSNCMTSGMHHRTGLSNGMAERHILLAARLLRKCVTIQYLSLCISHLNLPRCPFPGRFKGLSGSFLQWIPGFQNGNGFRRKVHGP